MVKLPKTLELCLESRSIVLIGLMGVGKSKLGEHIAAEISMPFFDTDLEVEKAAGCSISDIFTKMGEQEFRAGEKKVVKRILQGKPAVIAAGGGAFMDKDTRNLIALKGISIWLRADVELLFRRTVNRTHRPLLNNKNPKETLARLIRERAPFYGEADIIFDVKQEHVLVTAKKLFDVLFTFDLRNLDRGSKNE